MDAAPPSHSVFKKLRYCTWVQYHATCIRHLFGAGLVKSHCACCTALCMTGPENKLSIIDVQMPPLPLTGCLAVSAMHS